MSVAGTIADAARRQLPMTWDALSGEQAFGDGLLQDTIDLVKEQLFGVVITEDEEDDYPKRVLDFAGKMVAVELVSPGTDLWMNQPSQETATGVNEIHAFVDRAQKLKELGERLAWQIRREERAIFALLGRATPARSFSRPGISTPADDVLLTPNPREFPAPFRQGTGNQRLS